MASGDAGAVTLVAAGGVSLSGGGAVATTAAHGRAGGITIRAGRIALDNGQVSASAASDGGPINFQSAGGIRLSNGASVRAETFAAPGRGVGGDVALRAGGAIRVTGGATVSASALGQGLGGGVSVTAGTGLVVSHARLAATAAASGGQVTLASGAGTQLLDGANVRTDTAGAAAGARGGNIFIGGGGLSVGGGSVVATTAANQGTGGRIVIRSANLSMSGGASLSSSSTGSGDGGVVRVQTPGPVSLASGSRVVTTAAGGGAGGRIVLLGSDLFLSAASVAGSSTGAGNSGVVRVRTPGQVRVADGSTISTAALLARGGDVRVEAGTTLYMTRSDVTAEAAAGDAGSILLTAGGVVDLLDSRVLTSAAAPAATSRSTRPSWP